MTKYRFVQVACPPGEITCTDDTGPTDRLFCSYNGLCGLNKNNLDSAQQVISQPKSASESQVTSFVTNQAGGAVNDGTTSYAAANWNKEPLVELKGQQVVEVLQSYDNKYLYQACTAAATTACDVGATATFVQPEDSNSRVIACMEHTKVEEPRSFQVVGLMYCKHVDTTVPGTYNISFSVK